MFCVKKYLFRVNKYFLSHSKGTYRQAGMKTFDDAKTFCGREANILDYNRRINLVAYSRLIGQPYWLQLISLIDAGMILNRKFIYTL